MKSSIEFQGDFKEKKRKIKTLRTNKKKLLSLLFANESTQTMLISDSHVLILRTNRDVYRVFPMLIAGRTTLAGNSVQLSSWLVFPPEPTPRFSGCCSPGIPMAE